MLTITVLFVGLTLATAVIAYWSDNLGKKLGKKRVSLWGMRPRTTATFLTIASSWLIMVFTLAVLLIIWSPLRQSLLHYQQVKRRIGVLQGQIDAAAGTLKSVETKLSDSKESAQNALEERQKAVEEASRATERAQKAGNNARTALQNARFARANLNRVSAQLSSTQQQRQAAQSQLQAAQGQLQRAQQQLQSASSAVQAANAKVQAANAQVEKSNAQVERAKSNLEQVKQRLGQARQNERIAKDNERNSKDSAQRAGQAAVSAGQSALEAQRQAIEAENKVTNAQIQVDKLEEQSQKLKQDNAALNAENERIVRQANEIFLSDVRVPVGYTLVARSFEQTPSFSDARDELRAMFEQAAPLVTGDKTKNVPPLLPGARLELLPLLVGDDSDSVELSPDEIYAQLANVISRNRNALSVRLIAARNHRLGDKTLDARFVIVPIRPALAAETELASTVLDGRASDANLFSALLKLVNAGRDFASQNGVSPPLSPDQPDFYAPGANEQLFKTLRAISAINGPTRVRILTLQPISTVDQLRVRFELEALAPSNALIPTA